MLSKHKKIAAIYEKIAKPLNVGDEYQGDVWIEKVFIGDVMEYFWEKRIDICWSDSSCALDIRDGENSLNLFNHWENKRLPLEEQSFDCVDFIYKLISRQDDFWDHY